jgi:hypothetical protein
MAKYLNGQQQRGDKGCGADNEIDGFRRTSVADKGQDNYARKRKDQGCGKGIHFSTSVR